MAKFLPFSTCKGAYKIEIKFQVSVMVQNDYSSIYATIHQIFQNK